MWHANGNADGNCHIHSDGDCDGNCHIHANSDCDIYCNGYCDGNCYSNSDCDRTAAAFTDATTTADAAGHPSNCFDSSDCTGFPKTDTLTCVACLTQGGMSWQDGSGCHTTCP